MKGFVLTGSLLLYGGIAAGVLILAKILGQAFGNGRAPETTPVSPTS